VATRKASQLALEAFTAALPELLGGSADLTGSNLTQTRHTPSLRFGPDGTPVRTAAPGTAADLEPTLIGRHINYGVREFGMAAIMNGVALHGGFIPYGGTFLTFSDYSRNAIRMAALMKRRVIHVFTHDSIGLGEDGPTHQPVEHAASLRLIPNLDVWRPCDGAETAAAWASAVSAADRPTALLLSRQNLPAQPRTAGQVRAIARGGYVLADADGARAVIVATGSEVALALQAQAALQAEGLPVRVVSLPAVTVFESQPRAWRDAVLPPGVPRIAVEAGVTRGWADLGCVAALGIDRFGESAPAADVAQALGFTVQALVALVKAHLPAPSGA
jgi:transketolase